MAAQSWPAPAPEPRAKALPRRPFLKHRTPRRYYGAVRAAESLDERMRAAGISNVEEAEVVGCDEKQMREWRDATDSITIGDLYALDKKLARELLERVLVDLITGVDPSSNHR